MIEWHIWSCLFPGISFKALIFHGFSDHGPSLEVVAHSGCPVVKGPPAPGWIGEWLLGIDMAGFRVQCSVIGACLVDHYMLWIEARISFADGLLLALEFASSDAAAIDLQSGHGKGGLIVSPTTFTKKRHQKDPWVHESCFQHLYALFQSWT